MECLAIVWAISILIQLRGSRWSGAPGYSVGNFNTHSTEGIQMEHLAIVWAISILIQLRGSKWSAWL